MTNFLEIVRFEIDYRLRRPYTWILFAVFVAVACLMAGGLLVGEAERAGDLHANAPSLVGMATVLVSMIGLVISAALFSEAALRDHDTRMAPLFATSPITKTEYLAGRFAGTLLVNVLFVSIVPIVLMILMRPPFVKGELLGPFRAAAYLQPAIVILLPNVLFTGALLFAVGVLTRRALAVFATAAFVVLGAMLVEEYIEGHRSLGHLAALIEPCGFVALGDQWEFWTTHEKNTRPLEVNASLLWNRLLWAGVAAATLLFTRWRFRTNVASERRKGPRDGGEVREEVSRARFAPRPFNASFDGRARIRQLVAVAGESARALLFSRDFAVIAVLLAIMVLSLGTETISDDFRTPFWPLTQFVAGFLVSFLPALTMALLTLPVVVISVEEGLQRIPKPLRDGSLALGASREETLWRMSLPAARPAVLTGLVLAITRTCGAVAPLMLVGVVELAPALPLDGTFPYLHPARQFMHLGYSVHTAALTSSDAIRGIPRAYACAALLVIVAATLNLVAIVLRNRLRERYRELGT